jgi:hypothetical protein
LSADRGADSIHSFNFGDNISVILAESAGEGKSGNIDIYTYSLTANQGGSIGSLALSNGNGGDVTIKANDIFLIGLAPSSLRTSILRLM